MIQAFAASIIIRTKNEEALLGETLARIRDQTEQDFEIIVVDSGSTDRTLEIARSFPVEIIEIMPAIVARQIGHYTGGRAARQFARTTAAG